MWSDIVRGSMAPNFASECITLIKHFKLQYSLQKITPGDGNCFFHAICDQVQSRTDLNSKLPQFAIEAASHHSILRKEVVNFVKHTSLNEALAIYKVALLSNFRTRLDKEKEWQRYLKTMSMDGTWADDLIIQATSTYLGTNILLLASSNMLDSPWTEVLGNDSARMEAMTLVYLVGRHFQSILPCTDSTDECLHCGKRTRHILMHLGQNTKCKISYDMDTLRSKAVQKRKEMTQSTIQKEYQAKYYAQHSEQIKATKTRLYEENSMETKTRVKKRYHEKSDEIKEKRKQHYQEKSEDIKEKKKQHYKEKSEDIKEKRKEHYQEKSEDIKQKKKTHYQEKSEDIKGKKKQHYKEKSEDIKKKKKQHYQEKSEDIKHKKKTHYQEKSVDIREKRKTHHQERSDDITERKRKHYQENKDVIAQKRKVNLHIQREIKIQSTDEDARYKKFKESTLDGPVHSCQICHRLMFSTSLEQVLIEDKKDTLESIYNGVYDNVQQSSQKGKISICKTCKEYIKQKDSPPLCFANQLNVDRQPDELIELNDLEAVLIAKSIIFMKIYSLPKSRWNALKDHAIHVPITDNDILNTLDSISKYPRNIDDSGVIPVFLKRKKNFKNFIYHQFINKRKIIAALQFLKLSGHVSYQNIEIEDFAYDGAVSCNSSFESTGSASDSSSSDGSLQSMSSKQEKNVIHAATMLNTDYPESSIVLNQKKQNVTL